MEKILSCMAIGGPKTKCQLESGNRLKSNRIKAKAKATKQPKR
jgi:hypothetical protein